MDITSPTTARRILFLAGLTFLIGFFQIGQYVLHIQNDRRIVNDQMKAKHRRLVTQIDEQIVQFQSEAAALSQDLAKGDLSEAELVERITFSLNMDSNIVRVGLAFKPYVFDARRRLFGRDISIGNERLVVRELGRQMDYTQGEYLWFHEPLQQGPVWIDPEVDPLTQVHIRYAFPFTWKGQANAGVAFFDLNVARLNLLQFDLSFNQHQFMFIREKSNRFIVHANQDYLGLTFEQALTQNARLKSRANVLAESKSYQMLSAKISNGWEVGVCFTPPSLVSDMKDRNDILLIVTWLVLGSILLSCGLAGFKDSEFNAYWFASNGIASVCASGTVLLLILSMHARIDDPHRRITSMGQAENFMLEHNLTSIKLRNQLPIYVYSGIYLQTLDFLGPNQVRFTGYAWQRYPKVHRDKLDPGFIFPEASSVEMSKAYSKEEGAFLIDGWHFDVEVHQIFDYTLYPFGREDIWIQIWHKNFNENIILVPDVQSYKTIDPSNLPGLDEMLDLPGWNLERSWFFFREHTYDTNFGLGSYSGLTKFPELYFNVEIRKQITGPFFSYVFPVIIILILLFTILKLFLRKEKQSEMLGYNAMNVVAACAGFFLAVLFSHIGLRDALAARDILYLEYFYFITYGLIVMVAIDAKLFSMGGIAWIEYEDNFYMKVIFWPSCTATLFCITLLTIL